YWAPKSTTRMVSATSLMTPCRSELGRWTPGWSATHPHTLGPLEGFPLGLEGGGDHDLGLLEFLDRLVPAGGHGGPERAEQVHPAVVLVGRAEEDLLHGTSDRRLPPGPARGRGKE